MLTLLSDSLRDFLRDLLPNTIWDNVVALYLPHFALELKLCQIMQSRTVWTISTPLCYTLRCGIVVFELVRIKDGDYRLLCFFRSRWFIDALDLNQLTLPNGLERVICSNHWSWFCAELPQIIEHESAKFS